MHEENAGKVGVIGNAPEEKKLPELTVNLEKAPLPMVDVLPIPDRLGELFQIDKAQLTDEEWTESVQLIGKWMLDAKTMLSSQYRTIEAQGAMLANRDNQEKHLRWMIEQLTSKFTGYRLVGVDHSGVEVNMTNYTVKEIFNLAGTVVVRPEPAQGDPVQFQKMLSVLDQHKKEWFPEAKKVVVAPPGVEFLKLVRCDNIKAEVERLHQGENTHGQNSGEGAETE